MSNPIWGPVNMNIGDRASGFVMSQFNLAQGFAVSTYNETLSLINSLADLITSIDLGPDVTLDLNYFNPDTIVMQQPVMPEFPPYSATPPPVPEIGDLTLGEIGQLPTFDIPLPDIVYPDRPSTELPPAPVIDTTITDPQIPPIPSYTLPDVPVFNLDFQFPDPPSDIIADFDAIEPVNNLIVPANAFSYYENRYVSALLDVARQWMSNEITNGGTGLTAQSQADIYAMETERDLQAIADAKDRQANDWARTGWSLPDGVLEASLFALDLEYLQRRLDKSRDIRVEAERIAIQQVQFAIAQANTIETALINYENDIANRSLATAKATMDYALAVYDAGLKGLQADIEIYKAKAYVFETKIRAAIANTELYKAKLEAIQIMVSIDHELVELYKAQLSGVQLLIDIYRTEMEAAKILADIQTLRLQAQKLLVDIYTAQVNAKVSEYNMYEAAIRGELGKAQVYATEVDAFKTIVEEAKIEADLVIEEARVKNDIARTQVAIYGEEVSSYKTQIDAVVAQIDQMVRAYSAEAGVYEADARIKLGMEDVMVKVFEARITQAKAEADIAIKDMEIRLQALVAEMELRLKAIDGAATVSSHIAAGAMSAAHAQAHVGYSSSENASASNSYQGSNSSIWSEES